MNDQELETQNIEQPTQEQVTEEQDLQTASTEQEVADKAEQLPPVESPQALNIKRLRESKERAERERDELLSRLSSIEKQMSPPKQAEEEAPLTYSPDDLIEGRHLSQYEKKLLNLEKQLQNYQQQSTAANVEVRLKSKYADFDAVVTKDNLELLRITYPEIADSINSGADLYNKAVSAYTVIKKLGITPDKSFDLEKIQAQANSSKPRPLASVSPQQGNSPLSKANAFASGLTDDLKAQLLKEMLEAKKRN